MILTFNGPFVVPEGETKRVVTWQPDWEQLPSMMSLVTTVVASYTVVGGDGGEDQARLYQGGDPAGDDPPDNDPPPNPGYEITPAFDITANPGPAGQWTTVHSAFWANPVSGPLRLLATAADGAGHDLTISSIEIVLAGAAGRPRDGREHLIEFQLQGGGDVPPVPPAPPNEGTVPHLVLSPQGPNGPVQGLCLALFAPPRGGQGPASSSPMEPASAEGFSLKIWRLNPSLDTWNEGEWIEGVPYGRQFITWDLAGANALYFQLGNINIGAGGTRAILSVGVMP